MDKSNTTITLTKSTWRELSYLKLKTQEPTLDRLIIKLMKYWNKKR